MTYPPEGDIAAKMRLYNNLWAEFRSAEAQRNITGFARKYGIEYLPTKEHELVQQAYKNILDHYRSRRVALRDIDPRILPRELSDALLDYWP